MYIFKCQFTHETSTAQKCIFKLEFEVRNLMQTFWKLQTFWKIQCFKIAIICQ